MARFANPLLQDFEGLDALADVTAYAGPPRVLIPANLQEKHRQLFANL